MSDKPSNSYQPRDRIQSVSKLAHEIKNPLTAMMGYTKLMLEQPEDNLTISQVKEWADVLNRATISLLNTCERVLDDETSGQENVRVEAVDFGKLSKSIIDVFSVEAKNKGIELTLDISSDFPELHTDPVLLTEIMNNLIGNSIKFTPRGGRIQVRGEVDEKNKARILIVQDSGIGIPAHILMAFKRGETALLPRNDKATKGWGIGMRVISENAKKLGAEFQLFCPKEGGTVAFLKFSV